jgi:hypothetical protein
MSRLCTGPTVRRSGSTSARRRGDGAIHHSESDGNYLGTRAGCASGALTLGKSVAVVYVVLCLGAAALYI